MRSNGDLSLRPNPCASSSQRGNCCSQINKKLPWPGHIKFVSGCGHPAVTIMTVLLISALFVGGCALFQPRRDIDPGLRSRIVSIAKQHQGASYQWGGNTPAGFDCSGYVQYVFGRAGIDIPRTTGQQYDAGRGVARTDLRKGDLVFFTKWAFLKILLPPNHVGIYIGGDRFIHAPSSGKTVEICSLNNVYWRKHYKGARDLL